MPISPSAIRCGRRHGRRSTMRACRPGPETCRPSCSSSAAPPTGEMKRVQIDDMALDPTLTARTVPKAEQKAYLYAKLTMARGTPVLPGTVSLFRDATFVGNGQLPLLAPGEEHELGFGVD